ncbi:putative MIP18 family protein [Hypsibius exemplaris]|uniref:MIP18 family protein n=1 Tax=Hypsibius exemplaris TaxID=2072580 RepID=A0A9X6RKQ5_HYPEX|nr:putative MIP18 family protein [Hypsibius exemplaris]
MDRRGSEHLMNLRSDIFDIIRGIKDPEHAQSLEELKVVYLDGVHVESFQPTELLDKFPLPLRNSVSSDDRFLVSVEFSPTVPHCSLATLIGLCIRVKLEESYPGQLKLNVSIKEGTHTTATEISKQLNDKERVAAAMENPHMRTMVAECLAPS